MRTAQGIPASDALEAIAATTTVPELERAFLWAAPRLVDADAWGISWLDAARSLSSVRTVRVPTGFVRAYEDFGRANDALFVHSVRDDAPVHDRVLFDRRAWAREPVGAFLRDWSYERCMQSAVIVGGVVRATLHFNRATGGRPFTDADLRVVALLDAQLRHQLRCLFAERELERARRISASLLEHIAAPAVITTESAALIQVNHAAGLVLVSYRSDPQLWPEYATAVRANTEAIAAGDDDGDGALAARGDAAELSYLVRTTAIEHGQLFLSLFEPGPQPPGEVHRLSPREQMIADLVAQGFTNERIAAALGLSVNTVKDYLKRANRKLGTANRAQLAAWAQARRGDDRRGPAAGRPE